MAGGYRFYLEGEGEPFHEVVVSPRHSWPPVPRKGEFVGIGEEIFLVVTAPVHYFETYHEVALVVRRATLQEALEPSPETAPTPEATAATTPLDGNGNCAYCGDPDCLGGEECNFYDGSLG